MQKLTIGTVVPVEDYRVKLARETLAASKAGESMTEAARWWGRLEWAIEELLAVIEERS